MKEAWVIESGIIAVYKRKTHFFATCRRRFFSTRAPSFSPTDGRFTHARFAAPKFFNSLPLVAPSEASPKTRLALTCVSAALPCDRRSAALWLSSQGPNISLNDLLCAPST
jgi:hypothetical protein